MTTYTVVAGDTLWGISRRFNTTIDIILSDNSIITDRNVIQVGWQLTIRTPAEVAQEKAGKAQAAISTSAKQFESVKAQAGKDLTSDGTETVMWDGSPVEKGQTGRVRILRPIPLVERLAPSGNFKEIKTLKPPEMYRTFERITGNWVTYLDGPNVQIHALWNLGGNQWVYDLPAYVKYEDVPADLTHKKNNVKIASVNTPEPEIVTPTIPYFEPRGYSRPVLQIKKDNQITTMELRVLAASGGYTTQIQPNQTNGGWFINVAGTSLNVKTITGVFLDTKTNREFDDFIARYHAYLAAYRDGDYYSSAICSFFYKGREYKGLIAGFNYSDNNEQEPLLRRFNLQLLVLKEKGPENGPVATPTVITNKLYDGDGFFSDLRYLLINPITGLYGTER